MAVVVPAISEIFRGAGLKILVFRRGLVGALDGATGRCGARMGRAGRTARWLPPALAERLLDFERLDEAWPLFHFLRVVVRRGSK